MAVYRSAMGKKIDMGTLMAKNERVRAVSNAKLNARGDIIDSQGKIIKTANNRVNENYAKTVGNRSAHVVKNVPRKGDDPVRTPVKSNKGVNQRVESFELTEAEKELEQETLDDEVEVEKIKAKEVKDGHKTNVRRSQN